MPLSEGFSATHRDHPDDDFVNELQAFCYLHTCNSSYRALVFTLAGLTPAEHTSLFWTHGGRVGRVLEQLTLDFISLGYFLLYLLDKILNEPIGTKFRLHRHEKMTLKVPILKKISGNWLVQRKGRVIKK